VARIAKYRDRDATPLFQKLPPVLELIARVVGDTSSTVPKIPNRKGSRTGSGSSVNGDASPTVAGLTRAYGKAAVRRRLSAVVGMVPGDKDALAGATGRVKRTGFRPDAAEVQAMLLRAGLAPVPLTSSSSEEDEEDGESDD